MSRLLLTKDPVQEIMDMAKAANPDIADKINTTNFIIDRVEEVDVRGFNTKVTLQAQPVSGWNGSVPVFYNRVDLFQLYNKMGSKEVYPKVVLPLGTLNKATNLRDILPALNAAMGFNLTRVNGTIEKHPDILDSVIRAPVKGANLSVRLTVAVANKSLRLKPGAASEIIIVLNNQGEILKNVVNRLDATPLVTPAGLMVQALPAALKVNSKDLKLNHSLILRNVDWTDLFGGGEEQFKSIASANWEPVYKDEINARLALLGLPELTNFRIAGMSGTSWSAFQTTRTKTDSFPELSHRFTHCLRLTHGSTAITGRTADYLLGYNLL